MENQTEKKRFPWGWVAAGCGAVAVIAVVVVIVVVLVVVPAVRSTITNGNPSLGPITLPQLGSTPAPNTVPGSGTIIGDLPFKFSAVQDGTTLPIQSLMDQMSTALNLNSDTDFMAPKTYKGTINLDPSGSFTIGNGWCATDSTTLQQNLANMQFQLGINGTNIDLSKYPTLYFTDDQGHACALTGIAITPSGNLNGTYHMVLTQKFVNSLDDGITSSPYPAGDVTLDFNVQFRTIPNNGKNL